MKLLRARLRGRMLLEQVEEKLRAMKPCIGKR